MDQQYTLPKDCFVRLVNHELTGLNSFQKQLSDSISSGDLEGADVALNVIEEQVRRLREAVENQAQPVKTNKD
ncbi:TPA: hypothetical protein ACGSTL_001231 [Vibrio parahaemolyticus]|uniref:hypothetical protein n=1 Tax=Vibrio campbellii TaxID=680 RepID=UPI001F083F0B|nr:hypothetical protein [Vibrio campbellii]UMM06649.1 hypothetical protein MKR81_27260 [Vibrio campbellii]